MILAIRTDKAQAELYLLDTGGKVMAKHIWLADRELANTLLPEIKKLLAKNKLKLSNLTGVAVFTGSGSFTGLRIGTTVTNALGYGLKIKVAKIADKDWLTKIPTALEKVKAGSFV